MIDKVVTIPEEYCVSVWKILDGKQVTVLQRCIGHVSGKIDTPAKAASYYATAAVESGLLKPGERYEVDVSVDESDEWETILSRTA
jgi:hypothetical protein